MSGCYQNRSDRRIMISKKIEKEDLTIAVCQLISTNDFKKNSLQIQKLLSQIPDPQAVDIITLPENSFFMRLKEGEEVQYLTLEDPLWDFYKDYALKNNLMIHVGATPLIYQGKKSNATILIMPDGSLQSPYQKMHLFDIELENQKPVCESDVFCHGDKPAIVDFCGWKIGLTICYDIRFSELFLYYQKKEVDAIFVPSAFLVETGCAHWEILNRARAIETQSYIVSAAQGGKHSPSRETYGHTMVVDPWGKCIVEIKEENHQDLKIVTLHKEIVKKVRKQIPMKNHWRMNVQF